MTAFAVGWSLLKEWSPDWRRKAAALPLIDEDSDFGFVWANTAAAEAARIGDESRDVDPFIHPHHPSFVVKRPSIWGEIGPTERNMMRLRDNPFGAALEELGFPVVSEMRLSDRFTVQPRMTTAAHDPEDEGYERWTEIAREPFDGRRLGEDDTITLQRLANRATDLFARDRHVGNIGLDPKGMPRYFDYRLEPWYGAFDPRRGETKKERAEEWMGQTRLMGLELPISRMIDRLPDMTDIELENDEDSWDQAKDWMTQIEWDQDKLRGLLELLEPHSRYGTKQVTVGGKAIWGDDW